MNRILISLLSLVAFGLTMTFGDSCLADEDAYHQLSEQFTAKLRIGDISSAHAAAQKLCKYFEGVDDDESRRKYFTMRAVDLENILTLSPEAREEISKGLRLLNVTTKSQERKDLLASLGVMEEAYGMFSKNLPASSAIRLESAIELASFRRRYEFAADATAAIDLKTYHRQALESYGADSYITIALEMERALNDILGEHPEQGYERMRELLIPDEEFIGANHYRARISHARDFILTLYRARKHQWLEDDARETLLILTPHMQKESVQRDFYDASRAILDSFEQSERWPNAANLCKFVLLHEQTNAPEHREARLHFLEHRVEALRKLGEHEEADQVLSEITRVKLQDPRRRSRYTED